ncbi:MAG: adenylate/guanylate cyclase domain-containing protein [Verrucomicrobiota bacterium]|nr:adenylate/guanylate cyclase domain-containing protein [Verrucomicrobiota bacterium]
MRHTKFTYLRRTLWLMPIPLLWILLAYYGQLRSLQNLAMDWCFRVRGPIEAPIKLFYINLDQKTSETFATNPFPRALYAQTASAALKNGGAKTIFFDFVISPLAISPALDRDYLVEQDAALASVLEEYPNKVVLGVSFGNVTLPFSDISSFLPRKYLGTKPSDENLRPYNKDRNPYPESPSYPIWNVSYRDGKMQNTGWGRPGIINVDVERSYGPIARWMPAYVETNNEYHMSNYALGYIRWLMLTEPELGKVYLEHPLKPGMNPDDNDAYEPFFNIRNHEKIIEQIPSVVPYTFHTVAVELLATAHGVDHNGIIIDKNRIKIEDLFNGTTLYDIPLIDDQMIEINWFSPWNSLPPSSTNLTRAVEILLETSTVLEINEELRASFWTLPLEDLKTKLNALYSYNAVRKKLTPQRLKIALNYLLRTPSDPYNPMASMAVVLAMADIQQWGDAETVALAAKWFERMEGAIVLCGPTDPILQDIAPTPLDSTSVPRVSVHGNLLKTIVSQKYIHRLPDWSLSFLVVGLSFIISHLAMDSGRWSKSFKFGALLMIVLYVVFVLFAFSTFNLVIPLIEPVGAAVMTSVVGFAIQLILEERSKSRIKGMFGTYLSPIMVNRMIESGEDPKLGGSEADLTPFFSDVQSFSAFSEILTPVQLVDLMNEYLTAMTDIFEAEEGTLDKYIGDAIVGMFGAPVNVQNPAAHGCRTAILMQNRLGELRAKWVSEGTKWPPIVHQMRMRIGLNHGRAIVGNMGSNKRFNFTMMGDTVNLAARCESGAKTAGVYTLISRECKVEAEKIGDEFLFRFVDKWKVKGRKQAVDMYEVVGFRANATPDTLKCVALYEEGLKRYFAQDWDGALSLFKQSLELEPLSPGRDPGVHTNPSIELMARCEEMKLKPPGKDWDGVYEMHHK